MNAFDIGWIPRGWDRGQPLQVKRLRGPDTVAIISQTRHEVYDASVVMVDSITVRVAADQTTAADAWLEWWRA